MKMKTVALRAGLTTAFIFGSAIPVNTHNASMLRKAQQKTSMQAKENAAHDTDNRLADKIGYEAALLFSGLVFWNRFIRDCGNRPE
jgi:hypothetical protein